VLVHPTDFGETAEDRRRYIDEPLGYGKEGEELRRAADVYYAQQAAHFDPPVEAEISMSRDERRPYPSVVGADLTLHYPACQGCAYTNRVACYKGRYGRGVPLITTQAIGEELVSFAN
jgi:hypothetical protein